MTRHLIQFVSTNILILCLERGRILLFSPYKYNKEKLLKDKTLVSDVTSRSFLILFYTLFFFNILFLLTNNAPDEGHSRLFLCDHVGVFGSTLGPAADSHSELDVRVRLAKSCEVAEAILVYVQLQEITLIII